MARFSAVLAVLAIASASAFAPNQSVARPATSLQAQGDGKKALTSMVAAAFLLGNVLSADAAFAAFDESEMFGSSTVVAGRSGGRSGGRSSRGTSNSYKSQQQQPTRTIERTTVIQSPGYVASPVYMAPMYNPMPGLGLGLGLSAINDVGNTMRDYRQETEIQQSKAELQQARMKEAELEARLRNLEMAR
ncbi:predicted protein [Phaeodactylum tricornutum CCAP 1055/1]|jgi:hypothetical protein|uniref:Uncharacterized protein n=2 Tax=Phaeodactylum tricornutum TaxID=2850 RepID=B5Y3W6_PHATC|nr:predicted protein [Phaeodactylum tricornutum CCAP 1055/1]ACI65199.1 predicted protein [Phaeodactylum tricornutum CCAP 1055/1]|eukprot:XP_002185729.1 predicted protein [Phaeodactylum tricornutum CCAP 1055/1]